MIAKLRLIYTSLFLLLFLFNALGAAFSDEVTLTASVDEANVTLSDKITYNLVVSGSIQNLPEPKFPEFKDFRAQILNYRSMSTNIVNTQITVTQTYQAILYPTKEGTFTIPPATLNYNGKLIESNPVVVKVSREQADTSLSSIDGKNVVSAKSGNAQIDAQLKGKFFILPAISNLNPFVGEPVTVEYYLYNQNFALASPPKMDQIPEYRDFVKEITFSPENWQRSRKEKMIDGKRYEIYKIIGIALIPIKSGKITLDPINIQINLQAQGGQRRSSSWFFDPFDDPFFGSSSISVRLPILPVDLNIQPLPTEGRPQNFSGTVGNYTLSGQVDRQEITMDDVVTLKMIFKGEGDIEAVQEPKLEKLSDFTVYDVQKDSKKFVSAESISGEKKFEFILKPTKTGDLTIPDTEYSIFNPSKKKYETLNTASFTIKVKPGEKIKAPVVVSAPTVPLPGTPGIKIETSAEINYIKTKGFPAASGAILIYRSPQFIFLQIIPVIFVTISYFVRRKQDIIATDIALTRRRKARGEAAKRLRSARTHIKGNNDLFFAELSKSLNCFIADHFNLPHAGITYDLIRGDLQNRKIADSEVQEFLKLLEDSDAGRYTPMEIAPAEREKFLMRAEDIINSISKALKNVG